jgi:multiple sugar transport system substrate-binding protein
VKMNNKTASKKFRVGILAGLLSISLAGMGVQSAHAVVNLTFGSISWFAPNIQKVVDEWNAANPDIQIKVEPMPDGNGPTVTYLSSKALSGSAPDIFNNLDVYSDQLADVGFTEDLVKYFGTGAGKVKRADFNQSFLSSYVPLNFPDQVTGLPIAADATVVFYNKTIFKKAGIAIPKKGWTYEEFMTTCKKISTWGAKQKPQIWGLSGGPGGGATSIWQAQYNPMIKSFGASVYNPKTNTSQIGSANAIKAWTKLVEPWQNGCIPKYSIASGKTPPTYAGGQSAMEISVRALLPSYLAALKGDVEVVEMPRVNGGKPYVGGGSYGLGIAASSKYKAEAWKFIDWFYSTKTGGINTLQLAYGLVPPNDAGIKSGAWRSLPAPPANVDAFGNAIKDSFIAPKLPGQSGTALDDAILKALQSILLKKVSVADAFKKAEAAVTVSIKKEAVKK